jgi:hypothetical protein
MIDAFLPTAQGAHRPGCRVGRRGGDRARRAPAPIGWRRATSRLLAAPAAEDEQALIEAVIVPRPGSSVTRNPSPPWPDWPAVACASWPRAAAAHPQPAVLHRRGTLFDRHGPARRRPAAELPGRRHRYQPAMLERASRLYGRNSSAAANWPSASAISSPGTRLPLDERVRRRCACAVGNLLAPGARR